MGGKAPTAPPPMPTPVPKPKPTPTQFKFEMPPMPEMPSMAMPEMPPLKSPFTKPASKPTKAKADSAVGKAKKVSGRKPMTSRKPSAKTQPARQEGLPDAQDGRLQAAVLEARNDSKRASATEDAWAGGEQLEVSVQLHPLCSSMQHAEK